MKIDIEKTSELKNLLKVGTEHTVGYQGSTRKQGIVADSIIHYLSTSRVNDRYLEC